MDSGKSLNIDKRHAKIAWIFDQNHAMMARPRLFRISGRFREPRRGPGGPRDRPGRAPGPGFPGIFCNFPGFSAICPGFSAIFQDVLQILDVRCGARRCDAVLCGAVRCDAVRCGARRCDVVRCDAVRCCAVRCGAMRYGAMRCDALRCDAVRCDAMQCGAAMRCHAVRGVRCTEWARWPV